MCIFLRTVASQFLCSSKLHKNEKFVTPNTIVPKMLRPFNRGLYQRETTVYIYLFTKKLSMTPLGYNILCLSKYVVKCFFKHGEGTGGTLVSILGLARSFIIR